jgi:hypothetical protein
VKNLTVVPHPATLATVLAPLSMTKLSDTLTDGTGSFLLRVDNGSYDLEFRTTTVSMLPRWWVEGQMVDGDVDLPAVKLPPATQVVGTVSNAAAMPLVGADVQLFQVPAQNAACAPQDDNCLSPPRLIAEGTVGMDGTVSVLLPGSPN